MKDDRILLAHGSGGKLSADLVRELFAPAFRNPALDRMDDSAVVTLPGHGDGVASGLVPDVVPVGTLGSSGMNPDATELPGRLAITTDSHVVKPLFFEGGDIGRLAVCGTVNDLAAVGATPLYLTAGFILEEGLPVETLRQVVASMKAAAEEAGVRIVAGDTKVVERGSADGLYITTSGVGLVPAGVDLSGANLRPGDVVLLSGFIGDHGIAVLSKREGLEFTAPVASDTAPLNGMARAMLEAAPHLRALRDPTRGGLATVLNEFAVQSGVAIQIQESEIPVQPAVQGACEMLGYDPLYMANEGKLVAVAPAEEAEACLAAMRGSRYGAEARIIGQVMEAPAGKVLMKTLIGGTRVVQMLMGEILPRIC